MLGRHRAKKEEKQKLQGASGATYAQLLEVAIEAVVKRENDVYLQFHYTVKFQKGFPKGILVDKTLTTNTYKVKSRRLLDFLFDIGESDFNSKMLYSNANKVENYLIKLERDLEKIMKVEDV